MRVLVNGAGVLVSNLGLVWFSPMKEDYETATALRRAVEALKSYHPVFLGWCICVNSSRIITLHC